MKLLFGGIMWLANRLKTQNPRRMNWKSHDQMINWEWKSIGVRKKIEKNYLYNSENDNFDVDENEEANDDDLCRQRSMIPLMG